MSLRILWVKAGKLLPVDTGGKIRSFNLLKHLAARTETTLLSYYDGLRDRDYEKQIVAELPGAVAINTGKGDSSTAQIINYLRRLPSAAPYAVTKFTSPAVHDLLSRWDSEGRFDVAVCDFLSASLNFPRAPQTPAVLFQHNVESALWQRQAKHEASLVKRLAFQLEAIKMTRYERATVRRFQHVIAVSNHDRDLMAKMTGAERISVVPTGVDLKAYSAVSTQIGNRADNQNVLFLGSMDWEANVDGVDYFCRRVWPRVQAVVPNAKFYVVGRNPHARVAAWASDAVEITGRVDSVLPYLEQAAVFVVPLRIGGGTRLKIYEAMAAGKAVVSTTVGAEGLDVHHGEDILLADTEEAFATAVIDLLQKVEWRRQLGAAAARLAAQYDWAIISKGFEDILADVARPVSARMKADRELAQVGI